MNPHPKLQPNQATLKVLTEVEEILNRDVVARVSCPLCRRIVFLYDWEERSILRARDFIEGHLCPNKAKAE